jgi:VanZ family protein
MHQPPQSTFANSGRRLALRCLVVYWLLLILGTHWPQDLLAGAGQLMPSDKRLHFMAYAGLAGLLAVVLMLRNDRSERPAKRIRPVLFWSLVALAVAVAFGLVDEATQPWTGRDFEWADWWADICGATAGAAVAVLAIWLRMLSASAKAR